MKATVQQRLVELHQQRALLVERAELQRSELGRAFAEFERPLHWFNLGLGAAGWLRSNPAIASLSAAGVALSLGKLRRWIGHGFMVWEMFKLIRRHLPEHHEDDVNETAVP